jgi:hypothetical protein
LVRDKRKKDNRTLRKAENALALHCNNEGFGYMTKKQKYEVKLLVGKNRHIIQEKEWMLKSRAL